MGSERGREEKREGTNRPPGNPEAKRTRKQEAKQGPRRSNRTHSHIGVREAEGRDAHGLESLG